MSDDEKELNKVIFSVVFFVGMGALLVLHLLFQ
jgi:hypothetical protein